MQPQVFDKQRDLWELRYKQAGDSVVGRVNEDHRKQTQRIQGYLGELFPQGTYFAQGLDFGSGWGRMLPFLSSICGHVWAADIVAQAVNRMTGLTDTTVTPLLLQWPYQIPATTGSIDLVFACLVLQHITNEELFAHATCELARVCRPGGMYCIIDNAVDQAFHVKSRTVDQLTTALQIETSTGLVAKKITINQRPLDHWLILGRRKSD